MMTRQDIFWTFALALSCAMPVGALVGPEEAPATAKLDLQSYRFSKKKKEGKERLVFEFQRKDTAKTTPQLKVTQPADGKEGTVTVTGATLTSSIPSSVSESYLSESKYLGAVKSEAKGTTVTLKVGAKEGAQRLEALWLDGPPRLVIDVFSGAGSGKQEARDVAAAEEKPVKKAKAPRLSARKTSPDRKESPVVLAPTPLPSGSREDNFFCFHSNAQVALKVVFEPSQPAANQTGTGKTNTAATGATNPALTIDLKDKMPPTPASDTVVCFPSSSRLNASLAYRESRAQVASETKKPAAAGGPAALTPAPATDTTSTKPEADTTSAVKSSTETPAGESDRNTASKESNFTWAPLSAQPNGHEVILDTDANLKPKGKATPTTGPGGMLTPMK